MSSPWIAGLRSVALDVPDLVLAEKFYTEVWGLSVCARRSNSIYLRGCGPDHHLLALHQSAQPTGKTASIRHIDLRARSAEALEAVSAKVPSAGGKILSQTQPLDEPGGGQALSLCDGDGRIYRLIHADDRHQNVDQQRDQPNRLAHVVLNSHDVPATQAFLERAMGFRLTDRTVIMAFMNCNDDHHSIALGDADNDALNHIAFVLPDIDAVMRGAGRMRDAGYTTEWGPGRHGPGNNAFNYFIGPFDVVIEYTAEVEQIDDSYVVGAPADWAWPPGRVDQWGISPPPSARLKQAQKTVFFAPTRN